jgi:DNA replication protein DnaC
MNIETIKQQLRTLRLSTAANELGTVLEKQKKPPAIEWFIELLERELDVRKERALERRIKCAHFPEIATIEEFDWDFNPNIDKNAVMELASLKFLERNGIALMLGKPGNGKTHLALAIGLQAVRHGHKVYCTSVKRLAKDITLHKASHSLDTLFKKILSSKLWILDDWGVVSLNRDVSEEVFDLLDRRKHTSALVLTSNRDVEEWSEVFPDPILAAATIDRMFDRARVIIFNGDSYRLKGRISESIVDGETRV